MERLIDRTRPGKLAVFKLDITPYSPSEDAACPWVWECNTQPKFCAGGSGTTWRQALERARVHAARVHAVIW